MEPLGHGRGLARGALTWATAMPPRLRPSSLLRHAWMDLLSAAGFFGVFLLREHFEPETLSALLLWPVVFEMLLVFALVLAGMGDSIRRPGLRLTWFATVAGLYLLVAALGARAENLPWVWLTAFWLLVARLIPPAGQRWLDPAHRTWLFRDGLPYSIAVWVLAFFAYLIPMSVLPADCTVDAEGVRVCQSPAWLFATVWTAYFVIEALVRAWRITELPVRARR